VFILTLSGVRSGISRISFWIYPRGRSNVVHSWQGFLSRADPKMNYPSPQPPRYAEAVYFDLPITTDFEIQAITDVGKKKQYPEQN
jgi:hypothetical protein